MGTNVHAVINRVKGFISDCRMDEDGWRFASTPGGRETLYASCFACMLYHYTGELGRVSTSAKQHWAGYLNSWKDPTSGYFIGPELVVDELHTSAAFVPNPRLLPRNIMPLKHADPV